MARNSGYQSDPNSFGQLGMFGPMPYEVEEMLRQRDMQEAHMASQRNPEQSAMFNSSMAGKSIGKGIASLWGGEDPEVARAKQIKAISDKIRSSGLNPNNFEEFYGKLGEELAGAGFTSEAANVANALQSYKDKQATLEIKQETAANARLRIDALKKGKLGGALAQEVYKNVDKFDPASMKAYDESIDSENRPNGDPSLLKFKGGNSGYKEVGTTPDGRLVMYNEDGAVVTSDGKNVTPYSGPIKTSKGTTVTVGGTTLSTSTVLPGPRDALSEVDADFQKGSALDAKKAHDKEYAAARSLQPVLNKVQDIASSGEFIQGSLADKRVALERFGNTFLGWKNNKPLNNTDWLNAYTAEAVLPMMAKLGGNDSEEEQRKLRAAIANNTMTPEMIVDALKMAQKRAQEIYTVREKYVRGVNEGRTDKSAFWDLGGEWPDKQTTYKKDSKTTVESTTKFPAGANIPTPQPVQSAPVAPVEAPMAPPAAPKVALPPANIVAKYMQLWGTNDRDYVIRRLMEEKQKAQGGR